MRKSMKQLTIYSTLSLFCLNSIQARRIDFCLVAIILAKLISPKGCNNVSIGRGSWKQEILQKV